MLLSNVTLWKKPEKNLWFDWSEILQGPSPKGPCVPLAPHTKKTLLLTDTELISNSDRWKDSSLFFDWKWPGKSYAVLIHFPGIAVPLSSLSVSMRSACFSTLKTPEQRLMVLVLDEAPQQPNSRHCCALCNKLDSSLALLPLGSGTDRPANCNVSCQWEVIFSFICLLRPSFGMGRWKSKDRISMKTPGWRLNSQQGWLRWQQKMNFTSGPGHIFSAS